MNKEQTDFKNLERVREVFTAVFILIGLVLVQLNLPGIVKTYPLIVNKTGVYAVGFLLIVFTLIWHRLKLKIFSPTAKFLFETVVYLLAISLIVYFTGGIYSYFSFFYFLPLLNTSANLSLKTSVALAFLVSLLFGVQLIFLYGRSDFSNAVSIFALTVFGICLVTALGRFLAAEVSTIHKREEERSVEQLQEIDKLKDEFVFIIAHELRSPITAIRGYLELITTSKENLPTPLVAILQRSFSTSNKLASLISLLLEVARIETGKIRFYLQKIDVKTSVDFITEEFKKDIAAKEIQFSARVQPENYILFDKERLEEILGILLENAIKYTPEFGKIILTIETTEKEVLLNVADTGVGIAEEVKPRLYEKYYAENTKTGEIEVKGYGMGLYVAKQLLIRMNGDISCVSYPGRGTTFTLHLPKYWNFSTS